MFSEFKKMETLIAQRTTAMGGLPCDDWLLGIRLKDKFPMPFLNPYPVRDFLVCCASPEKVRKMHKYQANCEGLLTKLTSTGAGCTAVDVMHNSPQPTFAATFALPKATLAPPHPLVHAGGVRSAVGAQLFLRASEPIGEAPGRDDPAADDARPARRHAGRARRRAARRSR